MSRLLLAIVTMHHTGKVVRFADQIWRQALSQPYQTIPCAGADKRQLHSGVLSVSDCATELTLVQAKEGIWPLRTLLAYRTILARLICTGYYYRGQLT